MKVKTESNECLWLEHLQDPTLMDELVDGLSFINRTSTVDASTQTDLSVPGIDDVLVVVRKNPSVEKGLTGKLTLLQSPDSQMTTKAKPSDVKLTATTSQSFSIQCPFFSCPSVSVTYSRMTHYIAHYLDKHAEKNSKTGHFTLKCFTCLKIFKSQDTFVAHIKESSCFNENKGELRPFVCPQCTEVKAFKRKAHLKAHLSAFHYNSDKILDNE